MVVRLTSEKASSCIGGDWKQLEILKRQFQLKGSNGKISVSRWLLATQPLSYSIEGNRILLAVTGVCDAYVFLPGMLTDEAATGDYGRLDPDGFSLFGSFAAVPVKEQVPAKE